MWEVGRLMEGTCESCFKFDKIVIVKGVVLCRQCFKYYIAGLSKMIGYKYCTVCEELNTKGHGCIDMSVDCDRLIAELKDTEERT